MLHAGDRRFEHGNVQRVELLAVFRPIEVGGRATGADDDVARPGGEIEGDADGFSSLADDDDLFANALVAVAVGADVRVRAVDLLKPRNIRPHVAQPDGEQEPPRADLAAAGENELELFLPAAGGQLADRVDQLHAVFARFVASQPAQLRGLDAGMAEKTVDTACFPVARIARVDEYDAMQVAREPDAGGKPRGSASDDGDVV